MRLQLDGDMEVSIGETITVEIEANDTAFLAHTGGLQQGQWTSVDHVSPLKQVRKFTVSALFSNHFSFATAFDFSPAPGGNKIQPTAEYTLRITGTGPTGYIRQRSIAPTAILPTSRVFSFEVGQG